MATITLLVFLEECVYIYKKVPANKKSVIIWVNGAAPVKLQTDGLSLSHFVTLKYHTSLGYTYIHMCAIVN